MRKYVIIGAGAAGLAAAETIREKDPSGSLTTIGDDPHGFYSRPGIAYLMTGETSERLLALKQGSRLRHIRNSAVALRPDAHELMIAGGRFIPYDRLLLATGSQAVMINNPGWDLEGVVKLDSLRDAREMIRLAGKGKKAVVIGGGIIAMEIVEGLTCLGMKVHYFLRGGRYWPDVLDETESHIVEKRLKARGVVIEYHTRLDKIEGKDGKVIGVETEAGQRIACSLVAVAIGVQPRIDLARSAGIKVDRGIITDEYLQTGAQDVLAAGDVAQVTDPATGKAELDTFWSTAVEHGRTAARNMLGENVRHQKRIAFNVCRLAGVTTTIIGSVGQSEQNGDLLSISRGDSETWRLAPNVMAIQSNQDVNRVRIMAGPDSLLGAVVMGDQTLSRPLHDLVANHVDITPAMERLQRKDIPLTESVLDFWLKWSRDNETAH